MIMAVIADDKDDDDDDGDDGDGNDDNDVDYENSYFVDHTEAPQSN